MSSLMASPALACASLLMLETHDPRAGPDQPDGERPGGDGAARGRAKRAHRGDPEKGSTTIHGPGGSREARSLGVATRSGKTRPPPHATPAPAPSGWRPGAGR